MKTKLFFFLALIVSVGMWGQTTVTITNSTIGGNTKLKTNNYDSGAERTWSQSSINFGGKAITCNTNNSPNTGDTACQYIQSQKGNGVIYNTSAIPGIIKTIKITQNNNNTFTLYGGTSKLVNSTTGDYTVSGTSEGTTTGTTWTSADLTSKNYTYFAIKKANDGASYISSIEITYTTTAPSTIGWCNLQYPSTGSINEGNSLTVYGQVYKSGVTEPAGQGAGIQAWVGYSSSNTNPNTAGWTWVSASYNGDSGNNDEYKADIGSSLPPGTYYYATRYKYNSEDYIYGGTSGIWNNDNGSLTVSKISVGWGGLTPTGGSINEGGTFDASGQVYISGKTPNQSATPTITAEFALNSSDTDPSTWSSGWTAATPDGTTGNNNKYKITFGSSNFITPGNYYYAVRYKIGNGDYYYAGANSGNDGGKWDGSTYKNGVITVNRWISWGNYQSPCTGSFNEGDVYNVYGRVYIPGVTPPAGHDPNVEAQVGYSTSNNDPKGSGWTWIAAQANAGQSGLGDNDEYMHNMGIELTAGTYYLSFRYRYKYNATDYSVWYYAGRKAGTCDGSGGGEWDGTTNVNAEVTVLPIPKLNTTGTVSAMTTVYGTASSSQNFSFTGSTLSGSTVTATPPAGFEVATASGGPYGATATYSVTSGSASGTVYIRLAATTKVGTYSGNITLSDGTTSKTVSVPNSTVTQKTLTITGLSGVDKVYDGNTTATLSGTAALTGIVGSDNVSLSGSPTANFNDKKVGTDKPITVSGYSLTGTDAGNYTLTQPTGLKANITAKALTVTGAVAQDKVWDGTTAATITGATLSGLISPDVVTISGGGTFAQSNAGNNIAVTAGLTLGGTDAGNYSLTQPTGLKANITKKAPTITTSAINILVGGNYTLPGSNITSDSNGAFSYSITAGGHATYDGASTLNGISLGTETLTINQAEDTNYTAGSTTVAVNVTSFIYNNGDVRPLSDYADFSWGGTSPYYWEEYNGSTWSNRAQSPQANKPSGRIIINKVGVTGGGNVVNSYNDIIILNGSSLVLNDTTGTLVNFINPNKTLEVQKGGTLTLNGQIQLASTANLVVRDGGTFELNSDKIDNSHTLWSGIENFEKGSTVTIKNWNWTASTTNMPLINSTNQIKSNTDGYKFGNLLIDTAVGANWTLVPSSGYQNFKLCENNLEISNTSATNFITGTSNNTSGFIVNGDFIIYDGWFNFGTTFTGNTSFINNYTINGNFSNISNDNFKLHHIAGGTSTPTGSITIEGDVEIGKDVIINNDGSKKIVLETGDVSTPKIIDIATNVVKTNIDINTGYRRLNQDLVLGTNSLVSVLNTATLDFGFDNNNTGTTPLVIRRFNNDNSQIGQKFSLAAGGTLKITSPLGITSGGDYTGNVQVGSTSTNRDFNVGGIYHYIGKANQVSGNGLPTAITGKVIVQLDTNALTYNLSTSKTIITGGELDIRKGLVIDAATGFSGAGKLTMNTDAGARYRISQTDTQPALTGDYNLTTGVVEFNNSQTTAQTINNTVNYKYQNIEVTGQSVGNSSGNIALKPNGTFTVKNGGIFTIRQNSIKCYDAIKGSTTAGTGCAVSVENNAIFRTGNGKGFSGTDSSFGVESSSIDNNITNISLANGSTVDYLGEKAVGQEITRQTGFVPGSSTANYSNLTISGDVVNEVTGNLVVDNILEIKSHDTYTGKLVVGAVDDGDPANVLTARKGVTVTAGDLILKNNAQLMQDVDAVNSGNATVERSFVFSADRKQYNFVSTPVDANMNTIYPGVQKVLYHSEATNMFYNASGIYLPGRALAVKEASGSGITTVPAKFIGKLFAGELLTYPVTYTTGKPSPFLPGYNLVGNPYPSGLDLDKLYTDNSSLIDSSFYFWDNRGNLTFSQYGSTYNGDQYAKYNAADGTGTEAPVPKAAGIGRAPNRYAKIGIGFMLHATTGGNLQIKNTQRTTNNTGKNFTGKGATIKDRYWLTMTTPQDLVISNAVVYFDEGNNGFAHDDTKSFEASDDLYTFADTEKVNIQGKAPFTDTDVVGVGYNAFEDGNYTLALSKAEGVFANGQSIYLKDKQTGIVTDLSVGSYTFSAQAGTTDSRFEIVYKPGGVLATSDATKTGVEVYRDGTDFVVRTAGAKIDRLEVYDASGRLWQTFAPNAKETRIDGSQLSNGVYILKIEQKSGTTTKRILK